MEPQRTLCVNIQDLSGEVFPSLEDFPDLLVLLYRPSTTGTDGSLRWECLDIGFHIGLTGGLPIDDLSVGVLGNLTRPELV